VSAQLSTVRLKVKGAKWSAHVRSLILGHGRSRDLSISRLGVAITSDDEGEGSGEEEGDHEGEEDGILPRDEYSAESRLIGAYLASGGQRPVGMSAAEFKKFKNKALKFVLRDGHLFRRPDKANLIMRRVIDDAKAQEDIVRSLHDEAGHRGREATFRRVADRYYWEHMWKVIESYVKTCDECQKRSSRKQRESLYPTWVDSRWEKVAMDVVSMPKSKGKSFLVVARSDLSGWVEARALSKNDSTQVASFLFEDVICRHGIFRKLVCDGGPENKGLTATLTGRYGIKRVVTSAYHPEANGMVERGHRPLVDSLSKLAEGPNGRSWVDCLAVVLWADRTTVRASTGMTPYEFEYGSHPVLPIELEYPTWSVLEWDTVTDESDLVAMRARALQRRDEDIEEAKLFLRRMRERNKEYFDGRHVLRTEPIGKGCLVLLFNRKTDIDMSSKLKLAFKWLGPYRVVEAHQDKGTYILEDLQGARLRGTFPGHHLKRFYTRGEVLSHPQEGERSAAVAADLEYELRFEKGDEGADNEQENRVSILEEEAVETLEDEQGSTGFRIVVPPVTARMREEYMDLTGTGGRRSRRRRR
jgi:Integrase zinc binding domain